jgi:fucose permease
MQPLSLGGGCFFCFGICAEKCLSTLMLKMCYFLLMDKTTRKQLDFASRSSMFTYANTAVIIPVSLVAITSEMGFSLTQAGSLSLIGSILQFAVLLGSIPIAAELGKIRPLRWGIWILGIGLALFTGITSFASAILIITVIAFGQAVIEALLTPLVEDIHPEDDGSQQVLLHAFWPMGIIIGTIAVGESLSRGVNWRTLFLILGALCIAVGAIYPRRSRAKLPRSRADFSHAGEILSEPLFWLMGTGLFMAGGAEGGFTFWTASYIQIEYGTLPRAGGLGIAFFAAGMASGRLLTSRMASRIGLRKILIVSTSMALVGSMGFFLINNIVLLYAVIMVLGLCIGPFWPGIQTYTVRRLGADPTMVMVFLSCFGILGFSLANFAMGIIGDMNGLRFSFLVAPVMLLIMLVLILSEKYFKKDTFRS